MPALLRSLAVLAMAFPFSALLGPLPAQSTVSAEQRRTLRVDGVERIYFLFVPSSHRRTASSALVLVFHGGGGRAQGLARHTGFSAVAEREGFVVAYPQGLGRRWNDGRGYGTPHDDVGFVRALLDTLQRELGIDPRRIYATGISNGAMFSYRLACDLPGVFAAIAPVAGALPAQLAPVCGHALPVSVAAFQGTADPLMPYGGGGVARRRGSVLGAERSIAFWAEIDVCAGQPSTTLEPDRVRDGTRVRRLAYEDCREGRSVVLYTIEGGGHTWPGGPAAGRLVGRVSREVDATTLIWGFFAMHARAQ
jgi:polyhydroxybutyrate depolymerase